tara:strand:+ start:2320 stop:2664 length:345 start_codon:yes stop_codon:yes gene_type:complete
MAVEYKNKKVDLVNTANTILYTVPASTSAIVKSLLVSEDSGNADTITVTLVNSSSAIFSLFKTKSVGSNATEELLTRPLVVQEGEIIKVAAATGGRLHVVLSLMEVTSDTNNPV